MNNFKELQKIQEEQYKLNLQRVQQKMDSNLAFIGLFTEVVEMYLTRVIDCFLEIAGADGNNENKST